MNYLMIDDLRNPPMVYQMTAMPIYLEPNWVVATTYNDFIKHIEKSGLPDFISFDHDLGELSIFANGNEASGYDCAKWLIDYCFDNQFKLPDFYCHSMNPVGKANINSILNSFIKFNRQ